MCDLYEKGVTLCGLSKSFGLPGLRLGWLATRDRAVLEGCMALKDYTTICASAPSETLGIIALRKRQEILRRNREILMRNLEAARSFFSRHEGLFRWMEPEGGPVAFPVWLGAGIEDCGVMIAPGSLFEFPGGHFRVGMGRRNFAEALERVEEFVWQTA
jgi:aspartate/methionine/tyrosine aminotransferase